MSIYQTTFNFTKHRHMFSIDNLCLCVVQIVVVNKLIKDTIKVDDYLQMAREMNRNYAW